MDYNSLFIDKKLPNPLNQVELYDYFKKYKAGDENARKIIIEHNIKLVISIVNSFTNTIYDKEELIAVGIMGLIKGVDTFDISKNFKFATYAGRCISNEILMFFRKENRHISDISLDSPCGIDKDGKEMKIEDTLYDEKSDFVSDYEDKKVYLIIRKIVESLPDRDKEIIKLYYGFIDGVQLKQQQIADRLNISRSYVSRIIKSNKDKIATLLNYIEIAPKRSSNKTKKKYK